MQPRTFLYVPADRADRLAKAHARGADAVVADLEDAVVPANKDAALANVEDWLGHLPLQGGSETWVRLNSGDRGIEELAALAQLPALTGVFVPKVESLDQLAALQAVSAGAPTPTRIAPMIESATGLIRANDLASSPGVHQLHLGEIDLAADLGMSPGGDDAELAYARARVVVASRYAGLIAPAAPVSARIDDLDWFATNTRTLARMGFVGRDCIHPAQVKVANDVFTPDVSELRWAREVLAQSRTESGAFRGSDGSMVDEAVLRRARNLTLHYGDIEPHNNANSGEHEN